MAELFSSLESAKMPPAQRGLLSLNSHPRGTAHCPSRNYFLSRPLSLFATVSGGGGGCVCVCVIFLCLVFPL